MEEREEGGGGEDKCLRWTECEKDEEVIVINRSRGL